MPWATIHWRSEILDKQTTTQVLLPRVGRPPYPVLYLLHGLNGDSTAWLRHSRLEWYLRDLPLTVVLPDGYRGFYTDNQVGPAYARHMGEELPSFVEKHFRAKAARGARAIGGLSMGGYGALRIALGYPARFCSAHSHSGALLRSSIDFSPEAKQTGTVLADMPAHFIAELRRVFGSKPGGTAHDLIALAERAKRKRQLPKLRIDCGRTDDLLADNREFHAQLRRLGVPHVYREHPGGHDWDYWDLHIRSALEFHARNLNIRRIRTGSR
ncbi:MAG: alpha/beta hydrolase family protein [Opitutaceae bacterium]|nr:alpha/beta hydrolase family protein [Opitutaceae bacterium]